MRQPKLRISRVQRIGVAVEAIAVPQSVAASARPRLSANRLDTALVQTIGLINTAASAIPAHTAHHDHRLGPTVERRASAAQTSADPTSAIRLGPRRSTASPANGPRITAATALNITPEDM